MRTLAEHLLSPDAYEILLTWIESGVPQGAMESHAETCRSYHEREIRRLRDEITDLKNCLREEEDHYSLYFELEQWAKRFGPSPEEF